MTYCHKSSSTISSVRFAIQAIIGSVCGETWNQEFRIGVGMLLQGCCPTVCCMAPMRRSSSLMEIHVFVDFLLKVSILMNRTG
jgi:hypothetical protein